MFSQYSPNMLKTFEQCPKKYYFKYVKNINMPVDDDIFEFGKNIHALASYYLRGENIDNMEKTLTPKEAEVWSYLKSSKYFSYDVVSTEYNLSVRVGKNFFGGRLDALVKDNNKYYILDYKTGSVPKDVRFDYQTIIYILAVSEFYKTNDISFVYIDLKNKSEHVIEYSDELKLKYIDKLTKVISNINNMPQKCNQECKCEYLPICY